MSKVEIKAARRYAKALFESCDAKHYESVANALTELGKALQDSSIKSALVNPSFSSGQRSSWIAELVEKLCAEEAEHLKNFFSALVENGRMNSVPAVAEYFSAMFSAYKKLLALEVTSARELNSGAKETLSAKVKSSLPPQIASGVTFDWKTRAELLGGLQVRVGDKVLDGSVEGAINKIARQLRT